jgi:hypothetical protein
MLGQLGHRLGPLRSLTHRHRAMTEGLSAVIYRIRLTVKVLAIARDCPQKSAGAFRFDANQRSGFSQKHPTGIGLRHYHT